MQRAIILIGNTGSGKSTLYNKILDSTSTQENYDDATVGSSSFGKGFMIFNTPGLGGESRNIYRVAGVLAAFKQAKAQLCRIILVVKFKQTSALLTEIENLLKPFTRYLNSIIVAITHWDLRPPELDENMIKQQIKQQTKLESLFFAKQDEGIAICQRLYQIIGDSREIILTQGEIEKNFYFLEFESENAFIIFDEIAKRLKQFRDKAQNLQVLIENVGKFDDIFQVMQFVVDHAKKHSDEIMSSFEDEIFSNLELDPERNYYTVYCFLREKLQQHANLIDEKMQTILNEKIEEIRFKNRLCPRCGNIWVLQNDFKPIAVCQNVLEQGVLQSFLERIRTAKSWFANLFSVGGSRRCGQKFNWRIAQMASVTQIGIPQKPNLREIVSFQSERLQKSQKIFQDNLNQCISTQINILRKCQNQQF